VDIETVIYMAAKVCVAMKPRASTDEDTADEPFRTVVAVGSAGVRSEVVIAVRASGLGTDADADLSLCFGSGRREANYGDSGICSFILLRIQSCGGGMYVHRVTHRFSKTELELQLKL
jgi:hypothetical protein